MFESDFEKRLDAALGDRRALIDLAGDAHEELKVAGCRKLVIAAAWADAHSAVRHVDPDRGGPTEAMDRERWVSMGPVGCPQVAEGALASLALAYQTSVSGARCMIGDALNLRHRMPRTWERVRAGHVHAWKARDLAQRTAHLSPIKASEVDALLADQIELLSWRRFGKILDATLLHVDELTYRSRAAEARTSCEVRATPSSDGLRTLIARAAAGDVTVFLAMINRIADVLADEGDEDPVGARRAKALSVLAYPDRALDLLLRHAADLDTHLQPWQHSDAVDPDTVGGVGSAPFDVNDPWSAGPPPAGWQTEEHADYHQPSADDFDLHTSRNEPQESTGDPEDSIDDDDVRWNAGRRQNGDPGTIAEPPPARRYANTGGINLVDALAAFGGLDQATLERARPKIVITLHLSDQAIGAVPTSPKHRGVIRTEHGPITAEQLRQFLGDTAGDITVRPVLDTARLAASDAYEVPPSMRLALATQHPGSVFPYSPCTSASMDLDHTIAYQRAGPPGQTRPSNLGPLARSEHRARTHGDLQVRQPDPGVFVWRTPEGWIALSTNQGTLVLRDLNFARQIWHAAKQTSLRAAS